MSYSHYVIDRKNMRSNGERDLNAFFNGLPILIGSGEIEIDWIK